MELQEDAQEPDPVPILDFRSRRGLAQFRITNYGGASAHSVKVTWQDQLKNADGNDVLLGRDVAIPVIPRGESASVAIGVSLSFFERHKNTTCKGTISFENVSGRRYAKPFVLSGEHERGALLHNTEEIMTLKELQRIPTELRAVASAIDHARR